MNLYHLDDDITADPVVGSSASAAHPTRSVLALELNLADYLFESCVFYADKKKIAV